MSEQMPDGWYCHCCGRGVPQQNSDGDVVARANAGKQMIAAGPALTGTSGDTTQGDRPAATVKVRPSEALARRLHDHAHYLDEQGCDGSFGRDLMEAARILGVAQAVPGCGDLREALDTIEGHLDAMRSLKGWRLNIIRENLTKAKAAIAAAPVQSSWQPPEGFVLVPKAAIKWLHGEGRDDNGKWFGDAAPEIKPGKPIARYWWRTTFRRMCSVPSTDREGAK